MKYPTEVIDYNPAKLSLAKLKSTVKKMFRDKYGFVKSLKKLFSKYDLRLKESWITIFFILLNGESTPRELNAAKSNAVFYAAKISGYKVNVYDEDYVGCYSAKLEFLNDWGKFEKLGTIVLTLDNSWRLNNKLFKSVADAISHTIQRKQILGVA